MTIGKDFPPGTHRNDKGIPKERRRERDPLGQNRWGSASETKPVPWPLKSGWENSLANLLLERRIEVIERMVSDQKTSIDQKSNFDDKTKRSPFVAPIVTLAPEPYELSRPLNIVLTQVDDGFIASFPEANLGSSGDTMYEAIDNLKDLILTVYREFETEEDDSLGPAILKQKKILFDLIKRSREA